LNLLSQIPYAIYKKKMLVFTILFAYILHTGNMRMTILCKKLFKFVELTKI